MTDTSALIATHLAALANVPHLTDMPSTLYNAERLAARVRWFDRNRENASAMLGPNGMQPEITACVGAARFHGFDWRDRSKAA